MSAKKSNIQYICSNCGYQSPKWLGKCPECGEWNTFEEVILKNTKSPSLKKDNSNESLKITSINKIEIAKLSRIKTDIKEVDRVLGGGIIPGSVILIGGEPGIGKSTLLLQIANNIAKKNKILYVSGEESLEQIKHRADRLNIKNENLLVLSETNLYNIINAIEEINPSVVIIDSIQTIYNPDLNNVAGSVVQIKNSTGNLLKIAKENKIGLFLVGHITKEGAIAGPKLLEHIVDVVLYIIGEKFHPFRILYGKKNRFGSTSEIGVFEMNDAGLIEVNNPSIYFLNNTEEKLPGSIISSIMEGSRPILLEIQALIVPSTFPYPKRIVEGIDYNKASIIIAILEKIAGVKLSNQEIYIKVVGGLKINEPSIDMGIAFSILSSYYSINLNMCAAVGEIGLTGEIRAVPFINQRLQELKKAGIKNIFLPFANKKNINHKNLENIKLNFISYIKDIKQYFKRRN